MDSDAPSRPRKNRAAQFLSITHFVSISRASLAHVLNSTLEVSIEADFTAVSIGYGVVPTAQPIVFGLPAPPAGNDLFFTPLSDIIEALSTRFAEDVKFLQPVHFRRRECEWPLRFVKRSNSVRKQRRYCKADCDSTRNSPSAFFSPAATATGSMKRSCKRHSKPWARRRNKSLSCMRFLTKAADANSKATQSSISPAWARQMANGHSVILRDRSSLRARSVMRMEITEVSAFKGELHISLQGYKTLGQPGTPTGPRSDITGGFVDERLDRERDTAARRRAHLGALSRAADCRAITSISMNRVSPTHLEQGGRWCSRASSCAPQYCGLLENFSQFTDLYGRDFSQVETPGLQWIISVNHRPLYPYVQSGADRESLGLRQFRGRDSAG